MYESMERVEIGASKIISVRGQLNLKVRLPGKEAGLLSLAEGLQAPATSSQPPAGLDGELFSLRDGPTHTRSGPL